MLWILGFVGLFVFDLFIEGVVFEWLEWNGTAKNDWFFMIFAIPGSGLILLNSIDLSASFFIGIGITLYGIAYFVVHEIFIHQRIKILKHTNSRYLKGIRRAHKVHHKSLYKEDGSCFGMLFVPYLVLIA